MSKDRRAWQERPVSVDELEALSKASNAQLLEEALQCAQGDDYDGCFTKHGELYYAAVQEELNERLKDWLERPLFSSEDECALWQRSES